MDATAPKLDHRKPTAGTIGHEWRRAALLSAIYCSVAGGHAVVERIFAGRLGRVALASLQASSTLAYGTVALVAAIGTARLVKPRRESQTDEAARTFRALRLALCFGLVLGLILVVVGPSLIPAFIGHHNADGIRQADAYVSVIAWAVPLSGLFHVATAALQARGDMRSPAWSALLSISVTTAAGVCFGIDDCGDIAWATVAGLATSTAFLLYRLSAPWPTIACILAVPVQSPGDSWRSFKRWEAPLVAERAVAVLVFFTFSTLAHHLTTESLAHHQVLVGLDSIGFHAGEGLAIATAAVAVRRSAKLARLLRVAMVSSVGMGAMFGVVMLTLGAQLETPYRVAAVAALAQPWMIASMVLAMFLRAKGRTRGVASVAVLGGLLIRLPMGYWLVERCGLGLEGLWLATGADHLAQLGVLVLIWREERRYMTLLGRSSIVNTTPLDVSPALS